MSTIRQIAFILICLIQQGFSQSITPQDKGIPYTRTAHDSAVAAIKDYIVLYTGSRYAWVYGYKMRLDDQFWQDETIMKQEPFVPMPFAALLSMKNIKPDPAPEYLKEKWVYTTKRSPIVFNTIKKTMINGHPYLSLNDLAKHFGFVLSNLDSKLLVLGKQPYPFHKKAPFILESIITQFDSPEKLADPDIATKYLPMLQRQGKWTDHVQVTAEQKKILDGPETQWPFTPKQKYNYQGFDTQLLGSAVPPPGTYPRILFSEPDLPMLRNRIQSSKLGQMSWMEIEHLLKSSWLNEKTSDGMVFKKLYNGQLDSLAWLDTGPVPNAPPSAVPHMFKGEKAGIYNSHISYVPECLSMIALYSLLKQDDKLGRQAAAAIVNYFRLREPLIDEWNKISDIEMSSTYVKADGNAVQMNGNGSATNWRNIHGVVAHMNLGFCLDFAGKWMNKEEISFMGRIIAKATYGKRAYGQDGPIRFRDVNWVTWDLPHFLALTAIEGLEGFDKEAFEQNAKTVKAFCEWGIDSSGVIYESNGKTPGGMQFHTLAMIALARRGENLWGHPHIRKLLEAQVQMTSPSGTVIVNSGTQYVPYSQQQFSLQTVNEYKAFYPGNKIADYLLAQAKTFFDKDESFREAMREWTIQDFDSASFRDKVNKIGRMRMPSPMYPGFVHGFLYDTDFDPLMSREKLNLPLDFNAPVHGVYSGYSDTSKQAVWMNMMVRPNHYLGAGHHHADAGMFHFSALGVDWITESPFPQSYAGKLHNQVLVDGKSQAENDTGTKTAYQAPARYLGMQQGVDGSFASADLTNSYTYRWLTQPPGTWDKELKALNWELDPSETNLKIFAGTSHYKMRPWWPTYTYSNYMPTARALFNPMQYVYRTVGIVRGQHAYGIVIDDLKKDDSTHFYQWTAMLNGGIGKVNISDLPSSQLVLGKIEGWKRDGNITEAPTPKVGDPLLLVYIVPDSNQTDMAVTKEILPSQGNWGSNYDRLAIQKNTVKANFRVLLIPFVYGKNKPLLHYANDQVQINWLDGQTDRIIFSNSNAQTHVQVIRAGKVIATSKKND